MTKHARRRRAYPLAALVGAALTFAAVPAAQAATVHCDQVITANTTVSNNLSNCAGNGLRFGADGIVLNLNGHTIDGTDGMSTGIDFNGYTHDTVTNGKVSDFGSGVYSGSDDNTISKIVVNSSYSGIYLFSADRNRVTQSQGNNGYDGVTEYYGNSNRLDGVGATGNTNMGIKLVGDESSSGGTTLINSKVTNNGGPGIYVYWEYNDLVTKNVASTNVLGFYIDYLDGTSSVTSNTATSNHGPGFTVEDTYGAAALLIQGNHSTYNDGEGFYQAYGNSSVRFVANNAQANHAAGFKVWNTHNTVLENNIAGSPSALSGGGGGNIQGIYAESVTNLLVKGNSAHSNTGGDGIHIESGTNVDLRNNKTNRNADDGIEDLSGDARFTSNLADYNADFGLYAQVTDGDGGGNTAHHNGTDCSPNLSC